jgi:hypothetical protein
MSLFPEHPAGHTKVFLKSHQAATLARLHTAALAAAATRVQADWRAAQARAQFKATRAAVITLQALARGAAARRLAQRLREEKAATALQVGLFALAVLREPFTCVYLWARLAYVPLMSISRKTGLHHVYEASAPCPDVSSPPAVPPHSLPSLLCCSPPGGPAKPGWPMHSSRQQQ